MASLWDQNSEIVHQWLDMFNAQDVHGMVELYYDQCEHASPNILETYPKTLGTIYGKEPLRRWWRECFEKNPGLNYELINLLSTEDSAVLTYKRHGANATSVHKLHFELKSGKITKSRVENLDKVSGNAVRRHLSVV